MKTIILKLILILTLLIIAVPLLNFEITPNTEAYQIPSSHRPKNVPFALEKDIDERGAAGATVLILQIIAGALLYFAAPVAVIMIVYGGFQMVTSATNPEQIDQSKKHLTWAAIGLLLIIMSYSLVRIIISYALDAGTPAPTP